jgi:hypothetical protein
VTSGQTGSRDSVTQTVMVRGGLGAASTRRATGEWRRRRSLARCRILLTLYGDDSGGNAREIATVIMHPNGAEEIANQLLHAQLRAQES